MKTLLVLILFFISKIFAINTDDVENYRLKDIGYISIPKNMELQSGSYKKFDETLLKEYGKKFGYEVSSDRIVFQQKGLNNLEKSGFNSYARVILETQIGKSGDYEKLNSNFSLNKNEMNELNKLIKKEIEGNLSAMEIKIIKWYGISIAKVNGKSAFKTSYLRQLKDNPYVYVNMYSFQNNDRMYILTMSYRQSDEIVWKPLFEKILNSFTITNVR